MSRSAVGKTPDDATRRDQEICLDVVMRTPMQTNGLAMRQGRNTSGIAIGVLNDSVTFSRKQVTKTIIISDLHVFTKEY